MSERFRPKDAQNDFWILTDLDLSLAIKAVQRELDNPAARSESLWSFGADKGPTQHIYTLAALRREQMRRLNPTQEETIITEVRDGE
jgi:hypothetical protein